MKVEIEIPDYFPHSGFRFEWEDGFILTAVIISPSVVKISGNQQGLISLGRHLLELAQPNVPSNYHFHLDESNSLEDGSVELIIEKI